jgi:hypothetical protein
LYFRDGTNESVRIRKLAPYQSYEFEVTYKTNSEEAPFSQKVEARTKEGGIFTIKILERN